MNFVFDFLFIKAETKIRECGRLYVPKMTTAIFQFTNFLLEPCNFSSSGGVNCPLLLNLGGTL